MDVAEVVAVLDEAGPDLRFDRAILSSTLDNPDQGVSVVDRDMRLVSWNRRYEEMYDYPEGLLSRSPVADLIRYNALRGELGGGHPTLRAEIASASTTCVPSRRIFGACGRPASGSRSAASRCPAVLRHRVQRRDRIQARRGASCASERRPGAARRHPHPEAEAPMPSRTRASPPSATTCCTAQRRAAVRLGAARKRHRPPSSAHLAERSTRRCAPPRSC